jgi:hypothetical protein
VLEKLKMYNQFMNKLNCLLSAILLLVTTSVVAMDTAAVNANMAQQQETCAKNTAMEWSATLNRCIGKQAAVDSRRAAQACDGITDLAAKEKCHISLAEQNTKLSSDTKGLNQGKTTNSMMMNGIAAAYTAINMISTFGKDGQKSNCTSKKILGVTSVAGLVSDVYLKMKAKKKVKALEGKYKLDTTTSTHEAQVSALEYLKDEQQTVVEIAGMEKKRNLALMLGYGIAAGWAVYEMTPFGANPDCMKPNEGETVEKLADSAPVETATSPVKIIGPQQ